MADDAAALLRSLGVESAHVAGFSGGSLTAQELALRHPDLVRSLVLTSTWGRPNAHTYALTDALTWQLDAAPNPRAALEAFFLWVYTARAHADGTVAQIIEEALEFPHPQSMDAFRGQLRAWMAYDSLDRVHAIDAPTLVLAGDRDPMIAPEMGKAVAERIPGAEFRVLPGESHQPFQERPDEWNAIVHEFWTRVSEQR
jgi:pimeloyl-ACP methyl ester carboxylesterase